MSSDDLKILGAQFDPAVGEDIITGDQIGLSRIGGAVIGACVK